VPLKKLEVEGLCRESFVHRLPAHLLHLHARQNALPNCTYLTARSSSRRCSVLRRVTKGDRYYPKRGAKIEIARSDRAAIILAGGDGSRLGEYIRKLAGREVPKQFFPLLGGAPLVEQTRRRMSLSVAPGRTHFVLNRQHETFFSPLLADTAPENLIAQPGNRGTAPAILYALLRLAETMPRASLVLMPSDHHVGDEARLMKHVDEAFEAVESRPELTVLLGAAPDEPETAYGWIERGPALKSAECGLFHVCHFWEKPSYQVARELMMKRLSLEQFHHRGPSLNAPGLVRRGDAGALPRVLEHKAQLGKLV
jgi:hypothetical protein